MTPARAVVVYDAQGGMYAARAWWMLLWAGHRAVSVLDGGLAAWKAAGGALEAGARDAGRRAGRLSARRQPGRAASTPTRCSKSLGRVTLLDARAGERYRGEVEPLDARAGHIPGARSRFFKDNLDAQGRFKPAAELRAAFAAFGAAPAQVVHQCGSGVTACHNLLAMEVAGPAGLGAVPGLVERVVVRSGAAVPSVSSRRG